MTSLGNKEIMSKNIKRYMDMRNVSATDICAELGFKHNTFSDWVNAKTYPRIDKIEMMANYFGISKSDLVEAQREIPTAVPGTGELLDLFYRVTPAQREAVLTLLRAFEQQNSSQNNQQ